jgi:glutamate-ammonia-ligase adenylyltransferase
MRAEESIVHNALKSLPKGLAADAGDRWSQFQSDHPERAAEIESHPAVANSLARVWACSEFVAKSCVRHPDDFSFLLGEGGVATPWVNGSFDKALRESIDACRDEAETMRCLRIYRRRETVRAAWRDLAGWSSLDETLGHMSELADVSIQAAVAFAHQRLAMNHGEPLNADSEPQSLLVLGMGKLGGFELNFSSDIDLIFLYPESGTTSGSRSISNEQFFQRLGQSVIRMLDKVTEDGFVFRVDMRLRPFGESGPLVMSLAAFEAYLQQHGRPWERYAFIKARPVTGSAADMELFRQMLRPFVYRRYLDYGVFETLRDMKQMIEVEAGQESLTTDIKRGRGGIREIEFITQCFQLLRGGADPSLRATALQVVLPRLTVTRQLRSQAVDELVSAYRFLRTVENRLQEWRDQQVHSLPQGDIERSRLAYAMGFNDWNSLMVEIDRQRDCVEGLFATQLAGADSDGDGASDENLRALWAQRLESNVSIELLASQGYENPQRARDLLDALFRASFVKRLDVAGRRRLDHLMPAVIQEAGAHKRSVKVLQRLIMVIEAVGLRSAYLALLNENRTALRRLADVCSRSEFLARQVADHPLLLDELIAPDIFDRLPTRASLEKALAERMAAIPDDELEGQMDALRQFQRSAVFLVAVADLGGSLPLMKVSDHLTGIAEVVLDCCVAMARRDMIARHGTPRLHNGQEAGFAVVAYGKMGGIELGYGSDLDLVFVHDSDGDAGMTDGSRPLDTGHFFARMSRRVVHLLSTQTSSGLLYEVDMRLKPSGKGGLLVTSLKAFETYQRQTAWTWEHQALLRARAVAGEDSVRGKFETIRRQILCSCVRQEELRRDIVEMRERMYRERGAGEQSGFDIKKDRGGITDIEFLVQFLVLNSVARHPQLVEYSDVIRQLESLVAEDMIDKSEAAILRETWLAYRLRVHHLALAHRSERADESEFCNERKEVGLLWHKYLGGD